MPEARTLQLARVIADNSTRIRAGDGVAIASAPVAMPLAEAVYERTLNRLSQNQPAVHRDMLCDRMGGGEILADVDLSYRSGEFKG